MRRTGSILPSLAGRGSRITLKYASLSDSFARGTTEVWGERRDAARYRLVGALGWTRYWGRSSSTFFGLKNSDNALRIGDAALARPVSRARVVYLDGKIFSSLFILIFSFFLNELPTQSVFSSHSTDIRRNQCNFLKNLKTTVVWNPWELSLRFKGFL